MPFAFHVLTTLWIFVWDYTTTCWNWYLGTLDLSDCFFWKAPRSHHFSLQLACAHLSWRINILMVLQHVFSVNVRAHHSSFMRKHSVNTSQAQRSASPNYSLYNKKHKFMIPTQWCFVKGETLSFSPNWSPRADWTFLFRQISDLVNKRLTLISIYF